MNPKGRRPPTWFYLILATILFLVVIRFIRLEIDPPYFFVGFSQAHLTDPYHLTFFARNAVLFDNWNPFDYHRWDIFKFSLISGTSYILFSLFGVSRTTANLTGLFLNLGGLVLFVFGLTGYRARREVILTTILLSANSLFIFYGRLPFLENGLIFFSGLIFFLFLKFHQFRWVQFLAGFLTALAALAGKLFGILLLIPAIVSLIYIYRNKSIIPILISLAGVVSGAILYILIFYGGNIATLMNYYSEQTFGIYGTPKGLKSPITFLLNLLTFGSDSGLLQLAPFYIVFSAFGAMLFILATKNFTSHNRENLPLVFSIIWILIGFLGLMPHNYRPLRYEIFLFLPMSAIAAYFINLAWTKRISLALQKKAIVLPFIFLVFWYLVTQLFLLFIPAGYETAYGAGIALIITTLIAVWLIKRGRAVARMSLLILIVPLSIGLMIRQGLLIYQGLALPGTYLKDYNREITELVDKDAVLTGPYTPAFTIDNNLKGIIYVFGLAKMEKDLFERFPITHILTDVGNWNLAPKEYPFLKKAFSVRRMKLRDGTVELFRVPGALVPTTDYEKAGMAFMNKKFDSVLIYSDRFVEKYPDNLTGRFGRMSAYYANGQIEKLLDEIKYLEKNYPDNFRVHMFIRYSYQILYKSTKHYQYRELADYHLKRALEINPTVKP